MKMSSAKMAAILSRPLCVNIISIAFHFGRRHGSCVNDTVLMLQVCIHIKILPFNVSPVSIERPSFTWMSQDRLIFNMRILILVKTSLYWELPWRFRYFIRSGDKRYVRLQMFGWNGPQPDFGNNIRYPIYGATNHWMKEPGHSNVSVTLANCEYN